MLLKQPETVNNLFIHIRNILAILFILVLASAVNFSCKLMENGTKNPPGKVSIRASDVAVPADSEGYSILILEYFSSNGTPVSPALGKSIPSPSRGTVDGFQCPETGKCLAVYHSVPQPGEVTLTVPGFRASGDTAFHLVSPKYDAALSFAITVDIQNAAYSLTQKKIWSDSRIDVQLAFESAQGYVQVATGEVSFELKLKNLSPKFDLEHVALVIEESTSETIKPLNADLVPEGLNGLFAYNYGDMPRVETYGFLHGGDGWEFKRKLYFQNVGPDKYVLKGKVYYKFPWLSSNSPGIIIPPYVQAISPNSATISWEQDIETTGKFFASLSESANAEGNIIQGYLRRVPYYDFRDPASISKFRYHYTAWIYNLKPDSTYFYHLTEADLAQTSGHFVTPDENLKSFQFLAFGDNRSQHPEHSAVMTAVTKEDFALSINTGDLVEQALLESDWLRFFTIEGGLMRTRLMATAAGNHDLDVVGLAPIFFQRYFFYGINPWRDNDPRVLYRSFNYGNAHFVLLNSNDRNDAGQIKWLEADLSAASKDASIDFIFATLHFPPYSSFDMGNYPDVREAVHPIFKRYKVDMVFSGHVHLYERSEVDGVQYIVTGGGGAPLHIESIKEGLNPFSRIIVNDYHYSIISIRDKTATLSTRRLDGNEFDTLVINK